jgi:outer membrane protein OmpA-like peptidoglycan-associated protein
MERDDRKSGNPEQATGSREAQRAPRPAPGKVTRTSRLSPGQGPAVQRKAAAPADPGAPRPGRSLWDLTTDPWMDAAHRGVTALAETAAPAGDGAGAGGPVLRQATGQPVTADAPAEVAARGFAGPASDLPYRADMEASFGTSFADVQAFRSSDSQAAADQLSARAYTVDNRVAFRDSNPSRELVAHELAHVVQGRGTLQTKPALSQPGDALEREADQVAARVAGGGSAHDHVARYQGEVTHQAHWGRSAGGTPQRKAAWGSPASARATIFRQEEPGGAGTPAPPGAPGPAAPAADAETPEAKQARKELAEFKAKTYALQNHVPSTGYGAFDVEYRPMESALNITVRCDFVFKDTATAKWGNGAGIAGIIERVFNQVEWITEYMKVVKARWSNQHVMQATKKHWEELRANTNVNVVYDSSNPHFRLTVHKTQPKQYTPGAAIDTPPGYKVQAPGTNPAWGGTLGGNLRSNVTQPKEDWRSATVATTDPARMRGHIPSPILFDQNSDVVKGAYTGPLEQLGTMLSMTREPVLTVNVVGHASTEGDKAHNQGLGQRRADHVAQAIRAGGTISHNMAPTSQGEDGAGPEAEWRRVDVEIPDMPATHRNDYDVAGHEFGHMVGLDEEYGSGAEPRSEHYQLVEEAFGTEVANTFVSREASSASIMSSGLDVRPYHYVTFWEALGRVTSPTLTRSDWKILT